MIEWPTTDDEKGEGEGAARALARFKKTGFAAELEEDTRTWSFLAYARSPEPPARMILRSDAGDRASFTLERSGLWRRA